MSSNVLILSYQPWLVMFCLTLFHRNAFGLILNYIFFSPFFLVALGKGIEGALVCEFTSSQQLMYLFICNFWQFYFCVFFFSKLRRKYGKNERNSHISFKLKLLKNYIFHPPLHIQVKTPLYQLIIEEESLTYFNLKITQIVNGHLLGSESCILKVPPRTHYLNGEKKIRFFFFQKIFLLPGFNLGIEISTVEYYLKKNVP